MKVIIAIFLTLTWWSTEAKALIDPPALRFNIGHSMLKFSSINTQNIVQFGPDASLSSLVTVDPAFLWDIPNIRSRIGLHMSAELASPYGFMPLVGIGLDYLFYPLGLSSSREVKVDGAVINKTRISPFLEVKITPSKMTVADPKERNPSLQSYFNITVIETSLGAGVDYPFSPNLTVFGGLHYRMASLSSQDTVGKMDLKGMTVLIGLMTNFY